MNDDAHTEYEDFRAEILRRIESLERGEGIRLTDETLGTFLDEIAAEVHAELRMTRSGASARSPAQDAQDGNEDATNN